ncbi:GNAT family N-acetyltransferase [Streptomyces sp. NPDC004327]|uniref:GNAT family N-acetyltransferase n=1 Tax=Streptomyces sp. NPDC004327 TaxID=3364699 RepID=UPI003685973C
MIGSNIRIQYAISTDLDTVTDLHAEARATYYRGHIPDAAFEGPEELARSRAGWAGAIDAGRVLVARTGGTGGSDRTGGSDGAGGSGGSGGSGGEIVGIAAYGIRDGIMTLSQLHVRPAHWRAGIGTALHTACTEAWRAAGVTTARLEVYEHNRRAQSFYAAHGWTPDPDTPRSGAHLVLRLTLAAGTE